jgi:hypothetical protein
MKENLFKRLFRKITGRKDIFLGGTCGEYDWRKELIPSLNKSYYAPTTKTWDEKEYEKETFQWEQSKYQVHVFTKETKGVLTIARLMRDVAKRPDTTYFCFIDEGMDEYMKNSFIKVGKMVKWQSAFWVKNLEELSGLLKKLQ